MVTITPKVMVQGVSRGIVNMTRSKAKLIEAASLAFVEDCEDIIRTIYTPGAPVYLDIRHGQIREHETLQGIFIDPIIVHIVGGLDMVIQVGFPATTLKFMRFHNPATTNILSMHRVWYRNDFWYWPEAVAAIANQIQFLYYEIFPGGNEN